MSYILIATSGSQFDRDAIREALGLLGAGHEVLFLNVHPGQVRATATPDGLSPAPVPSEVSEEYERQADQVAKRHLEQVIDLCPSARIRVESGDPGERICAVAAETGVDLVVVGTHDRGTLRRILGGSVSDNVAHHAPCPVLLIRPKHHSVA
jgi:nucleotide-binding universal stress UspA family protein